MILYITSMNIEISSKRKIMNLLSYWSKYYEKIHSQEKSILILSISCKIERKWIETFTKNSFKK